MTHCSLYVLAAVACSLVREERICPGCDGKGWWDTYTETTCDQCDGTGWVVTWRLPYADPGIDGPGTQCQWPFDPWTLLGAPIGQYHCPYCGSMVLAGMSHLDYADDGS